MVWQQVYDPFGNMSSPPCSAAVPVVVMLVGLGFLHIKAHIAAGLGLLAALAMAVFAYGMPAGMAGNAALYGGLTGLLPIGWIVLNIIFLHQLTEQNGSFKILQDSIAGITAGPAPATAADRLLLRRLLRGRGRLRHAGGGDRGHPDRAGLLAAGRLGPVADRQHRAGGLRRAGHAGHHAGQGARLRPDGAVGDDRPAAAVLLAAGAVLADLGLRRAQGDVGDLAGHPGDRARASRSRSSSCRTSSGRSWST